MMSEIIQTITSARTLVLGILIVSGMTLWAFSFRPGGDDFERSVNSSFASDVLREHHQISPRKVRNLSEMAPEEIEAAYSLALARLQGATRDEVSRLRAAVFARVVGTCCLLIAATFLVLRSGAEAVPDMRKASPNGGPLATENTGRIGRPSEHHIVEGNNNKNALPGCQSHHTTMASAGS